MQLEGALKALPEGVAIRIKVTPGSRDLGVGKYDEWRHAIRFKLTGQAQKGKANEELVRYLAALFNKPVKDVRLVSGHASSQKVVLVSNIDILKVQSAINQATENRGAETKGHSAVATHR